MTSYPKTEYIRSKALLEACREIPCQHCGAQDGTVVAAHSNQLADGKGRGIKASDDCVAALCYTCHSAIDQGSRLMRWEREEIWNRAHVRTVIELKALGKWLLTEDQPCTP